MFTYDFAYPWALSWGHLSIGVMALALAVLSWRVGSRRGVTITLAVVAAWGLLGALAMHYAVQIASPQRVVTESFVAGEHGDVLELGAGSGRATIGFLLARPAAAVTALDAYRGYYGIADNTPERLMTNARKAGVADRVTVQVADLRKLPFASERFDAAFSVAAIDHLPRASIAQTLDETARVLKSGGQLLIVNLNSDAWVRLAMPWSLHGHGYWSSTAGRQRWTEALERAGFSVVETGTRPATVYFLARKRERPVRASPISRGD